MNVLIYSAPTPAMWRHYAMCLNIGALTIATHTKHAGHNVKIIDGNVPGSLDDVLRDGFMPDILGISMLTMYGVFCMESIRKFIADVRNISNPVVVFGGPGSSVLSEILLNEKLADYVVVGPGEEVFVELLSAIATGSAISDVPSVVYLGADGSCAQTVRAKFDGYSMPLPLDYSLMDITSYIIYREGNKKSFFISASRGCIYRCTFCYNEYFHACSYQPRPVSVVIAEMKFLVEQYGITDFNIMDECFGTDKAWLHELCNAIIAELPPVTWWCQHHGGTKTRDDYILMRKAGCCSVFIGVESADPKMSQKIRKGLDLTRLPAEIDMLHELGFEIWAAFIVGFPDETREQLLRTCEFMRSNKVDMFYINKFYLIPHTKEFEDLESSGKVTMPKTLAEFQAYLSPKHFPNYSKVPDIDLEVIESFMSIISMLDVLFGKGAFWSWSHLSALIKSRSKGSGRGLRYLFSGFVETFGMLWDVCAHPFIRRRYGLLLRNFQRHFRSE